VILSNAAVRNRTTVLVLVVLIILAGVRSYLTLPRESFPDVEAPFIQITTIYQGVSPEDIETSVTTKIEKTLTNLKGLKEITSVSREGMSIITVELLPSVTVEDALQRVRDKVDLAKGDDFPPDAEEPILTEINLAEFPIMMVSISGTIPPVVLKEVADQLEDAIEAVPGVLEAEIIGGLTREIRLEIDPDRVAAYDLTIDELINLVPAENVNTSAGSLETEGMKFNVRVPAEFDRPIDIDTLVLAIRNGRPIYLTDVGRVNDTFEDIESISRLNGTPSITVAVRKRIGADILLIAGAVRQILDEAERLAPQGVEFTVTMDQSEETLRMNRDLENNILSGLILVLIVLVLFMGVRTSLIVALAIPLSMLMSFAIVAMLGYTLNMMVLFSLILALGMLVDNAIVVVENIYRHRQLGGGRLEAAMSGAAEVAWPVIASTATTIAAFSPMLLWPGMMGDFLKYLPATLIATLASSLFVAMVISPVICTFVHNVNVRSGDRRHWFLRAYQVFLRGALHHPGLTIAGAFLVLVGSIAIYGFFGRGMVFFPDMDPNNGVINVRCPQGTNIHHTDEIIQEVERRVQPWLDSGDLKYVVANVGSGGGMSITGNSNGPHIGNLTLSFKDFEDRATASEDILDEIRKRVANIPGAEIKVEGEKGGPPTGEPVTIEISGEDFDKLKTLSDQVKQMILPVPGLVSLRSDYEASRPELVFLVDRRRAKLTGVNTSLISRYLKAALFGREVGTYRQFNDEYDITVRLPVDERNDLNDLFRLRVPNIHGKAVPLSTLGEFKYTGGFGDITRKDRKRVITVTGRNRGRFPNEVLADVRSIIQANTDTGELKVPLGYSIDFAGEQEEQAEAMDFLFLMALPLACLGIVLILVMQFNTLSAPLIIMTTVLLSTVGVFLGLAVCQIPFSAIMTGIGVISLAGVVVNNAIVLLDYTRQLQRRGRELIDAIVEAGTTRLRPVILTAVTTIMGLIPMATGWSIDFRTFTFETRSESSQWWSSLAVAVIFGLAFATLLTLVIVPTLYYLLFRAAARHGFGGLERGQADETHPELSDY